MRANKVRAGAATRKPRREPDARIEAKLDYLLSRSPGGCRELDRSFLRED